MCVPSVTHLDPLLWAQYNRVNSRIPKAASKPCQGLLSLCCLSNTAEVFVLCHSPGRPRALSPLVLGETGKREIRDFIHSYPEQIFED